MSGAQPVVAGQTSGEVRPVEEDRGAARSTEPAEPAAPERKAPPGSPARGVCAAHGVPECKRCG
ncbi:hypothetical protein Q5530_07795 [Saccharothrix sp. BKS2]|uniref:hypothetical protein n=1 Tax=Saccharothrix sp. BKS2 TaxID=3064400 RepID=UPI0039E8C3D9